MDYEYVDYALKIGSKIASRLSCIDYRDLQSAAVLGALEAYEKFDNIIPFRNFAYKRIKGEVYDELRRMDVLDRGSRKRDLKVKFTDVSKIEIIDTGLNPEDLFLSNQVLEFARTRLSVRDFTILILSLYGISNIRIEERLELKKFSASRIKKRAIKKLRKDLL